MLQARGAGILFLIVPVSWVSFLIVGVLLAVYEIFLQRIKLAPADAPPPTSGPDDQAALTSGVGET